MHLTSSPIDWYAARAAGIAAYVVLTLVVSLGLAMSGKARSSKWPKFAVEDVHRFGGLLVGFFVFVAVAMLGIAIFRVLVVLTGDVWMAYLILGGIFVIAGTFVWTLRFTRPEDTNA